MPGKIVTLARFSTAMEAAMARNQLADAGIEAMVSGDESGGLFAGLGGAFGTVNLMVAEENYDRALDVLENLDEDRDEEAGDASTAIKEPGRRVAKPLLDPDAEHGDKLQTEKGNSDEVKTAILTKDLLPEKKSNGDDEDEDGEDRPLTWTADDFAHRAWLSSIIALMMMPIPIGCFFAVGIWAYSIWLLMRLASLSDDLSPRGTWKLYGAMIVDGLFFLFIIAWHLRFGPPTRLQL